MSEELIKTEKYDLIETKIISVRGMQVMLDSDIANLFEIETKHLNKAMKRNLDRFPNDFCFQLNSNEFKNLRFQNVTFNNSTEGRKYCPYVYTEHGIVALAGVLKSEVAAKMSVEIARAFVAMRHFILQNGDVLLKLAQLQNRQINFELETKQNFQIILDKFDKYDIPKQSIFFDGQYYDAYDFITSIVIKAKSSILLIDPYCDNRALSMLSHRNDGVNITICKSILSKLLKDEVDLFVAQYGGITVFDNNTIHDRFLIVDEIECYSLGTSLNYAGKKTFAITKIENEDIVKAIINKIERI